ncbi:MAG: hypothetical protein D6739_07780 [Nitrospirae bacterium]|nr:MAG: hypothetical protein D6739_07780 [Nitrospirota bacterium]
MRNQVAYRNHDVRLHPVGPEGILPYLRAAPALFAKRGRKVVELPPRGEGLSDAELVAPFLGRSGTLRAPTLVTPLGVVAGWDEATYRRLLGLG